MIRSLLATLTLAGSLALGGCEPSKPIVGDDTGLKTVADEIDLDGDGYAVTDGDCDDNDPGLNPGEIDVCDGIDNDCNGAVDDGPDASEWYADADGDGFGDPSVFKTSCSMPVGYVSDATDCDDVLATVNPDAAEICDGDDNNCDGVVDEGVTTTYYVDSDGDGYGDAAFESCDAVAPVGSSSEAGDCDDANATYNPGAAELDCADPNDYNCDGSAGTDDGDGDGVAACEGDCDDSLSTIYPGAAETCNEVDDDCDGSVDNHNVTTVFHRDADGDGYGDSSISESACSPSSGYVLDDTDCDDTDATYNPGAAELDCADPNDYNCDGSVGYDDLDVDGSPACEDCDDTDATVNPSGTEVCDEIDNNCDGAVDEGVTTTYYADIDADGYGDASSPESACAASDGFVSDDTDCDDLESAANPGEAEVCDEIDNNCDGAVDEGVTTTYYVDSDGDGYGGGVTAEACTLEAGLSEDSTDCDDADSSVSPRAMEVCDSANVDEDCDGEAEESGAVGETDWHPDADADGFGDRDSYFPACDCPTGYVIGAQDCDDADADVYDGAAEYCDGVDNDCDSATDEDDAVDATTWFADADADGFGDNADSVMSCEEPHGAVADNDDCDDTDAAVNPDADEYCDGEDDDCDGADDDNAVDASTYYIDADGDGYGDISVTESACSASAGFVENADDCDDTDATLIGDVWYADADGDGYGDASASQEACTAPTGYVTDDTDCDDNISQANPGEVEVIDGVDTDCDELVDWADDYDSDDDGVVDSVADAVGGNLFGSCASSAEEAGVSCTTGSAEYASGDYEDMSGNAPSSVHESVTTIYGLDPIIGDYVYAVSVDAALVGDWNSEQWSWEAETSVSGGSDVRCSLELGAPSRNSTVHVYVVDADTGTRIYPTGSSYEDISSVAPSWVAHEMEFSVPATTTGISVRLAAGDNGDGLTWYVDALTCQELL